jgi:trehalose 6-phosphate synthase/phosphatase
MKRLIIISNRLPVTVERRDDRFSFKQSVGGLATAVGSFYRQYDSIWVGWPGFTSQKTSREERGEMEDRLMDEYRSVPVFLTKKDIDRFYHGFCNKTIWPLFHYFPLYTEYDEESWKYYERINRQFCQAVTAVARADDTFWIHDYHLMLLPKMIRDVYQDASIGFFLHIPFPSYELFRLLPWRDEILEGLLGADLVGFHCYEYTHHFMNSVHRLLGYEFSMGRADVEKRIVKVDSYPIGIDYEKFSRSAEQPETRKEIASLKRKIQAQKIVLSVDRLDYSKGLPVRLEAINLFFKKYPHYKEKVTFIQLIVPSREQVEEYRALKTRVDILTGKITGEHAAIGWMPIWYLYRSLPFNRLAALYSIADVGMVTPLRDGMNLVAKEYVATKSDGRGVLLLSEMAGASKELGEALIVNPHNINEIVEKLRYALEMDDEEKVSRMRIMQRRLREYNVVRWANDYFDGLDGIKKYQKTMSLNQLTDRAKGTLLEKYRRANRKLILLDYDGTLVPFNVDPMKAKPTRILYELFHTLSFHEKNEIVLISGRNKATLDEWFGDLEIGLVAEHGVWIKRRGAAWEMIEPLDAGWKEEIRPILDFYVVRTPGSFVEEKDYSLVWHYRNVDIELAHARTRELVDEIVQLTANLDLQVLEGNKVIEVKNSGINKGRAAQRWIESDGWEFIMAVGDDITDEDIFRILPESAFSIKVGVTPSKAKYNVESYKDVLGLLSSLSSGPS